MDKTGRVIFIVAATVAMLCITSCISTAPDLLSETLSGVPTDDPVEERKLNARLVELGPRYIRDMCGLLTPSGIGDDSKVRYLLSGLATYAARPGGDADRPIVERGLIRGLRKVSHWEEKAFLIRQLQRIGTEQSVAPLGRFLTDERLCDPATQALLAIRAPGVEAVLLKALPAVGNSNQVTIINALGVLRQQYEHSSSIQRAIVRKYGGPPCMRWLTLAIRQVRRLWLRPRTRQQATMQPVPCHSTCCLLNVALKQGILSGVRLYAAS